MLRLVLKRMMSSRWMVVCLILGSVISTALISCIPVYSKGILQRMLTKDLENYQTESGEYPGMYHVDSYIAKVYKGAARLGAYKFFDDKINTEIIPQLGLTVLASKKEAAIYNAAVFPGEEIDLQYIPLYATLVGIENVEQHITPAYGHLPSAEPVDGIYEAIATEAGMGRLSLLMNQVYTLRIPDMNNVEPIRIKIIGTYNYTDPNDLFWDKHQSDYKADILINNDAFYGLIDKNPELVGMASWNYMLDYYQINLDNIGRLSGIMTMQEKFAGTYKDAFVLNFPAMDIFVNYINRAERLTMMLWILLTPVLFMILFYIFMVSKLIVSNDEDSIAVLKSRGAGRHQVFVSYVLESGIIGFFALALGPPAGLLLCRLLGASDGFLEFIIRKALPVTLNLNVYLYSLGIIAILMITMLIPAFLASKVDIIQHKQRKAESKKIPIWRILIDFTVLGISLYELYRYNQQIGIAGKAGLSGLDIQIDPVVFLLPSLFVLGAGLVFLRIFPLFIRLIYWLGKKIWSPVFYITLTHVGRSRGQEKFVMMFLIMAVSIGVFNANSARTINLNNEEKIRYDIGADVALKALWVQDRFTEHWYEPNYYDYANLAGVGNATKVMKINDAIIRYEDGNYVGFCIMCVQPDEFARIAWFRNDLMDHSIIEYLNLMTDHPMGLLVSSMLKGWFEEGDEIYFRWGKQRELKGEVLAFVDYWPSYNPNARDENGQAQALIVANMMYIGNTQAIEPYEVWIKKAPGATDKTINDDIINKQLRISKITYADQQLVKMKNDPLVQGTNGSLTLGFGAAMIITLIGFLIYWIISIHSRSLLFGVLRAMGLSISKVIGILSLEQILLSGTAIVAGILIGRLASRLYIPLVQTIYSTADQVPPFKIVEEAGDYIKIYAIIGLILLIGFITLWRLIAKIKIDQVVKLGED